MFIQVRDILVFVSTSRFGDMHHIRAI
jgi:hypothetical protein